MISYISTRNSAHKVSSSKAILSGQAPDGGLYIPENIEDIRADYHDIISKDFRGMARAVWNIFFPDYGEELISKLVERSYEGKFSAPEITPLVKVGDAYVLELYHGPTSAFKDVALSALPNLLTAAREMNDFTDEIMILTATSGDTGSAALCGFSDVPGTSIIVFYPYGGVSETQKLQMVTAPGSNTCACAIRGNFDDAQTGVKALFRDIPHPAEGVSLSSANSINIGRLVPQVVYYFAAYSQLLASGSIKDGDKVDFIVRDRSSCIFRLLRRPRVYARRHRRIYYRIPLFCHSHVGHGIRFRKRHESPRRIDGSGSSGLLCFRNDLVHDGIYKKYRRYRSCCSTWLVRDPIYHP